VAVYYKSVSCNPLRVTPLLPFVGCGFDVQLVSTVDKILADIARRAIRLLLYLIN